MAAKTKAPVASPTVASDKKKALETAMREKPDLIILQSRSPSCGVREIYDGTFSGRKIPGQGIFAEMLKKAGFNVIDVEDLPEELK